MSDQAQVVRKVLEATRSYLEQQDRILRRKTHGPEPFQSYASLGDYLAHCHCGQQPQTPDQVLSDFSKMIEMIWGAAPELKTGAMRFPHWRPWPQVTEIETEKAFRMKYVGVFYHEPR